MLKTGLVRLHSALHEVFHYKNGARASQDATRYSFATFWRLLRALLRPDPASGGQTRECQKLGYWQRIHIETVTVKPVKALEAPKETPEKKNGLLRLLSVVVAEVAVGAALLLK